MRVPIQRDTKYYKFIWEDWTQPTLTGNGVYVDGFCADSNYSAYFPNTGNIYIYVDEGQGWIHTTMRTKTPFIATKFTFVTASGWGAASGAYSTSFQGSNDMATWTTIGTAPDTSEGQMVTVDMSNNTTAYKYFKLNVRNGGWAYEDALQIYGLTLYGKMRKTIDATEDDYDYKVTGGAVTIPRIYIRKYYQNEYQAKDSPVFNSQYEHDGVLIVTGQDYYDITRATSHATMPTNKTITFDVGETSNGINSIGFMGVVVGGSYPSMVMKNVQCSEDNNTWTTISNSFGGRGDYLNNPLQITSPNNYRYIRFTTGVDDGGYSTGGVYKTTVNYEKLVPVEITDGSFEPTYIRTDYYKYIDTKDVIVPLYDSNNTSYINSSTNKFVVNSVTAWNTTQTYKLKNPIKVTSLSCTSNVDYIQSNCGWAVTVSATTNKGKTYTILDHDHGYNTSDIFTDNIDFDSIEKIVSITIYANCYRRSTDYCYGSINIQVNYDKRDTVGATVDDYSFSEDVYNYSFYKDYPQYLVLS